MIITRVEICVYFNCDVIKILRINILKCDSIFTLFCNFLVAFKELLIFTNYFTKPYLKINFRIINFHLVAKYAFKKKNYKNFLYFKKLLNLKTKKNYLLLQLLMFIFSIR